MTKIAHLARVLYGESKDLLFEDDEEELKVTENKPEIVNSISTIESTGKYIVGLRGIMTPGEVFVNGDLKATAYGEDVDVTLCFYLVKGDSIEINGAPHTILKVEYTN